MDQIVNLYTFLLHAVAVAHRYATVGLTVEVIGNAERRTDFILPAVPLADGPVSYTHLDVYKRQP